MASLVMAEEVFIEVQETYPKQTYRNRCCIATPKGIHALSIPVIKTEGNHTKTSQIAISQAEKWQQIHWRAIESAYNNSAFFLYYRDEFDDIYNEKHTNLVEFNQRLMGKLLKLLHIDRRILLTEDYEKQPENLVDFRQKISPKSPETLLAHAAYPAYFQAFADTTGFLPNLSILDLLCSQGPHSGEYLQTIAEKIKLGLQINTHNLSGSSPY